MKKQKWNFSLAAPAGKALKGKKVLRTSLLSLILLWALSGSAFAQKATKSAGSEISSAAPASSPGSAHVFLVEVDPLPYLLGGMGGHFGWTPKNSKHFAFGIGFVAGPEFPEAFNNINAKNKDMGWRLKVNQGAGLWTHYYFKQPNKGWFTGLQVITQEMELGNNAFPGQKDRTNILMLAVPTGYVWYPIKNVNLFLRPWAGLGFQKTIKSTFEPEKVTPEMVIGEREYHLPSVIPFATFHVGYTFR